MKTMFEKLPDNVKKLKTILLSERKASLETIKDLQEKNQYLLEQFRLAQHRQFGKSSEANLEQGELFNEAEQLIDEETDTQIQNETATRKHCNQPKRKPLPKDLPRETVIVDLSDEEKICDCCGNDLHKMGEKKSERLRFIPAQLNVIEPIRPQYSCRHCEQTAPKIQIKIAPVPASPIPHKIGRAHV